MTTSPPSPGISSGKGLSAAERSWLNDALAALHSQGVARLLSSDRLEQLATPPSSDLPVTLVRALSKFYADHPREAASDGVFTQCAVERGAVEALNRIVASSPTLDTQRWAPRADGAVDFSAMLPDCTELRFVLRSMDDLVAAFNSASHKTGDARVFVALRTGSEDCFYLLADMRRVDALARFLPFE